MKYSYHLIIIALVILLFILQLDLWIGKGSMQEVWQLEKEIAIQEKENLRLKERNQALHEEVKDLKRGLEAIDERARTDMGMIHQDETFFQIIKTDEKK